MEGSMAEDEVGQLAEAYFTNELGIDPHAVQEASENLLGYFRTLQRIQQRLETEKKVWSTV